MKRTVPTICLAILLNACSNKDSQLPSRSEMNAVRANLAFACVHESDRLPPLDSQADELFRYGLYLEMRTGPKDFNAAARYYRIAAAHGHYKANHNLQLLVSQGRADSPQPDKETIDLVEQLITAGVPGGYYDMGHYLELGYGVTQNAEKARRYFRKAADMGSPEAQAYVGKLLSTPEAAPDIARQMQRCAVDQGFGNAANELGIDLMSNKRFREAVEVLQNGVKAGDTMSASFLKNGFDTDESDVINYLALPKDLERAHRYKVIWEFLTNNDGLNPKVPDIDKIVPLPPAELPSWDGTFQWQREREAAVPPQRPSDELVDKLAKAKNLDPATGLPLPTAGSKASQADDRTETRTRTLIGATARAGARCPESGVWCAQIRPELQADTMRSFSKGDLLPLLDVYEPRALALLDSVLGKRRYATDVIWKLVAYEKA
jgi:TPR repeat protein